MVRPRLPCPTGAPGPADRPPSPRRGDGRGRADASSVRHHGQCCGWQALGWARGGDPVWRRRRADLPSRRGRPGRGEGAGAGGERRPPARPRSDHHGHGSSRRRHRFATGARARGPSPADRRRQPRACPGVGPDRDPLWRRHRGHRLHRRPGHGQGAAAAHDRRPRLRRDAVPDLCAYRPGGRRPSRWRPLACSSSSPSRWTS